MFYTLSFHTLSMPCRSLDTIFFWCHPALFALHSFALPLTHRIMYDAQHDRPHGSAIMIGVLTFFVVASRRICFRAREGFLSIATVEEVADVSVLMVSEISRLDSFKVYEKPHIVLDGVKETAIGVCLSESTVAGDNHACDEDAVDTSKLREPSAPMLSPSL